jgi:hypothetical protein
VYPDKANIMAGGKIMTTATNSTMAQALANALKDVILQRITLRQRLVRRTRRLYVKHVLLRSP